jgi:hypothetical protein
MSAEIDFFRGKRLWSLIKDAVLRDNVRPYLTKVNQLRRPILLVDGNAGPGVFEDGMEGSPLIMCQQAEEVLHGNYSAIFVNQGAGHHVQLTNTLNERGLLTAARPILGDANHLLIALPARAAAPSKSSAPAHDRRR